MILCVCVCVYVKGARWIEAEQRLIETYVEGNKVILCVCVCMYVKGARDGFKPHRG